MTDLEAREYFRAWVMHDRSLLLIVFLIQLHKGILPISVIGIKKVVFGIK